MSILPRLAVGTIQPEADSQVILWALLDALEREGVRTQSFLSRACFAPHDGAGLITGNTPRHLDSWLMSREACRSVFLRAAATADVAIVEGRYDRAAPAQAATRKRGGSLDTLCQWLDLPRLAIVDVTLLDNCCLPPQPAADGLLLDEVNSQSDFYAWQTILESLWGLPVVGAREASPGASRVIAELQPGQKPPREFCREMGDRYCRFSSVERMLAIAARPAPPSHWQLSDSAAGGILARGKARVAVAYDEAFNCYFPETLDMLELHGATIRVFSPLKDECLPAQTDIVYLGCGHPERHADALAENQCMLTAIKDHVCAGRRVYAEGGGLAYLCQHIELANGNLATMVGALRAVARRNPTPTPPEPVEMTLAEDLWIGPTGTRLRGYRNDGWLLTPTGCMGRCCAEPQHALDLVCRHRVIGSRVHLNFAAQPALLGGFLRPCPQALAWSGAQ